MLTECPECTTRYAPDLDKCPHCGKPAPTGDNGKTTTSAAKSGKQAAVDQGPARG